MSLSVVIPTLNEAEALPALLADLRHLGGLLLEVVVADADSTDQTREIARARGARVVEAPRGRARQLNAGAAAALGDWLLFLHADSRVGSDAVAVIREVLTEDVPLAAAVFRFSIDLPPASRRFIERGQAIRESWFGLAYGDQGLLCRRDCFDAVGGYPDLPLMEDVVIISRLQHRFSVSRLPAPILTSGRRYMTHGVLRTWLTHSFLIALFAFGCSPARLSRWRNGTTVPSP